MKNLILVAAIAMAAYGSNAAAATGGYVRGEFGNSDVNVDVSGLGSDDDNDNALVIGGGYYFNPNFAIDGFYGNLYDSDDAELTALGLGLVGKTNMGADDKGFYISGRVGIARMRGEVLGEDDTTTSPYFGVGAGFDFNENVGLGVNYTRYNADFDDISVDANTLTATVEFRF